MARALSRRISDAFCAFRTGHSVRDLDRVRRRRLRLLGDRLAGRLYRQAEENRLAEFDISGDRYLELANTVRDLTDRAVVGRERVAQTALLKKFDIDRASLYMRRRGELLDGEVVQASANPACRPSEPYSVASRELYGKMYEGLLEDRCLDLCFDKLRLAAWYARRLFLALKVRWIFCIRGKLPTGLISHGRYPVGADFVQTRSYQVAGGRDHA